MNDIFRRLPFREGSGIVPDKTSLLCIGSCIIKAKRETQAIRVLDELDLNAITCIADIMLRKMFTVKLVIAKGLKIAAVN